MNKEKIKEWLEDISTPTGLSYSGDRTLSNSMVDKIVEYFEEIEQENQQLKKQKDDIVELIKKQLLSNTNITKYTDEMCLRDVLRMLGEIDVED